MALADEIDQLRNETLIALNDAHDYHWNTSAAWRLVQKMVRQGQPIFVKNAPTRSTIRGPELASLGQKYVAGYLSSATFQHFIATFEWFAVDLMKLWLRSYPQSLGKLQVNVGTILECRDKSEVIDSVIEKKLLDIAYGPVSKWLDYIKKTSGIACPDDQQIARLAEMKASRDVLVHNNGMVNAIYRQKAGDLARYQEGELLQLPSHYHRESWEFLRVIINCIADAGIDKLRRSPELGTT